MRLSQNEHEPANLKRRTFLAQMSMPWPLSQSRLESQARCFYLSCLDWHQNNFHCTCSVPHTAGYRLNSSCHLVRSSRDLLLVLFLFAWVFSVCKARFLWLFPRGLGFFLFLLISACFHLPSLLSHSLWTESAYRHPIRLRPLNSFFSINSWLVYIACVPTTCPSCTLSDSWLCASGATYL